MVSEQRRVVKGDRQEEFKEGYFLSLDELSEMMRDFLVDSHDGYVSNIKEYVENWLKKK